MHRSILRGAFALAVLCVLPAPVVAQAPDAAVSGTVRDESGLPVPGVPVTITADGRVLASVQTGRDGTSPRSAAW
jgi:hypothetical protein